MNCFNHTDQPAVAQCQNCGKFLCKECATKYSPSIFCDECASAIRQEQQAYEEEKEVSEQKLFKLAVTFFVLNFVVYFIQYLFSGRLNIATLLLLLISSFLWAGVPYGWVKVSQLRNSLNFILVLPIVGWVIYFGIRVSISYCIGWFFLIKKLANRRTDQ